MLLQIYIICHSFHITIPIYLLLIPFVILQFDTFCVYVQTMDNVEISSVLVGIECFHTLLFVV